MVWVTAHIDYNLKGSTVASDFVKKPITYGPFSSSITIRDQASGAIVGKSWSSTSLVGRGKAVTTVYGTALDPSGVELTNVWIKISQGSNAAVARTDADGFYLFYDGQNCLASDGIDGGCTGASTATWNFANGGNVTTALSVYGQSVTQPLASAPPAFPGTWTKADVQSATSSQTVTSPTLTFGVAKGAAYEKNWRFHN